MNRGLEKQECPLFGVKNLLLLLLLIWPSPGLPEWRKVNLITVTRRPHHPSIAAGLYCLTTFSLLFARSEVGSFTCIGCDSPIHGTDGLKSPPKDEAMRIKRLAQGRYCWAGVRTRDLRFGSQRS